MQKVVIYTKTHCPYCVKAKSLLDSKGVKYQEFNVEESNYLEEMLQKSRGMKTVPQIFIGDELIGGCDDLHTLERQGKLDEMLR